MIFKLLQDFYWFPTLDFEGFRFFIVFIAFSYNIAGFRNRGGKPFDAPFDLHFTSRYAHLSPKASKTLFTSFLKRNSGFQTSGGVPREDFDA